MFASVKIVISGNNYKENQKLQKLIQEHGGEVSLLLKDQKSVFITTDKFYSYKIKNALKLGVPVVSPDYIYDSVEQQELQETDDYIVPFPKEQSKYASPAPVAIVFDIENVKSSSIAKYNMRDANSRLPYFPHEYEIIKSDVFRKNHHFCALELHVAGVGVSEVLAQGNKSGYERTYFRVFMNHGRIDSPEKAALECIPAEGLYTAEETYGKFYDECVTKNYENLHLTSINHLGSEKAKSMSFLSLEGKLPEKVKELVMTIYNEATSYLCDVLVCHDGLRIDAQGRFNVPFGKLSMDKIDTAESLLLQIHRLQKQGNNEKIIEALVKEFHHSIPTARLRSANDQNLFELVMQDLDDLQHTRDALFVCEHLGSQQTSLLDLEKVDKRYLALGCKISHISEKSSEFNSFVSAIQSMVGEHKITVNNLYEISRNDEREAFPKYLTNQKLLFQACRPGDVLGILSRGILPRRTGPLGAGMYFVSDAAVSVKNSPPNGQSGKRFMIASNVALGVIRKFPTAQPHLVSSPDGFDSVQGVKTSSSKATDFAEDEFVIFNKHQYHLSYLIEFSSDLGDETLCPECNAAKPTELRLMPVYASEIHTEDLPTILPPLDPTPPLRVGGLMLKGKPKDEKTGFFPVSLKSSHITANITDLIAEVTVVQYFVVPDITTEIGTYVLPLDATTSVCGFECFVNGHPLVLKMQERVRAKHQTEEALTVEESSDIFHVNLGFLPPSAHVIIVLKYNTELPVFGDEVRFVFPSFLTPTREEVEANPEDPILGCSIQVAIEMPHDISSLTSPTHEIHTKRLHTRGNVTLASEAHRLAEDFVLCIGLEESHATRMWLEEDESGHCVSMLTFNPRFDMSSYQETELLFVVDSSSSMQTALPEIQRILRAFIARLQVVTANITFNIITFASATTRLFLSSQSLTPESLQTAWKFVNEMRVHYGGTDTYTPLHALYLRQFLTQIHTSIFLFTDGHVQQPEKVIALVKQNATRVRLFTYGVGPAPSRHFIRTLAEAGNGTPHFILPDIIPNPTMVADQLTRATQPAYCISVKFDTREKNFIQAPAKIIPVFPGQTKLVFAFAGKCTHANIVTVGPGGRIMESSVHVREDGFVKGSSLHCAFVRTLMRDQQEGTLSSEAFMDDFLKRQLRDEIVRLSIKHSIESRFTCYGNPEQLELPKEKQPVWSEMISKLKADNLPHIVWKEVEEARLIREAQREVDDFRNDLLDSAQRAKERKSYRDFADFMYKLASLKTGWNMAELRELGKATRSVVKPVLDELREEANKLVYLGKDNESLKLKRARKFIQLELERFVGILENQVEPFVTSAEDKAYVQKLKERSKKVMVRAAQDLDETAYNLTRKIKIKQRRRTHHEFDEEEEEGEGEEGKEDGEEIKEGEREITETIETIETIMTTTNYGQERKLTKVPSYENYLLNYNKHYQIGKEPEKETAEKKTLSIEPSIFIKLPYVEVAFVPTGIESNFHRAPKQCFHGQKAEAEAEGDQNNGEAGSNEAGRSNADLQADAKAEEELAKSMPTEEELAAKKGKKKASQDAKKNLRYLIKNSMLLRRLKAKQLVPLADAMSQKPIRAGRYVIREGDRGDYFYIVESGTLEVYKKKAFGSDQKVGLLTGGMCFGEIALWFNENRTASVRSVSECVLWTVSKEVFCKYTSHLRDSMNRNALRYGVELVAELTDYERAMINYLGESRRFDDAFLFREGEVLYYFYLVIAGNLEGMKGNKKATGNFDKIKYHGYKALTTGLPTKFSVKGSGPVDVLMIPKQDFLDYVMPVIHRVATFECLT